MTKFEKQYRNTQEAISEEKELMLKELDAKLSEELEKTADQVDGKKVDEYLDQLYGITPDEAKKEALWAKILEEKKRKDHAKTKSIFLRCAAAVVIVVGVLVASFHTAKAFKWTFLLKLLNPVAETFGIYTENSQDTDEKTTSHDYHTDSETGIEQQVYTRLEDMPAMIEQYPIVPQYVPQGYTFLQGTLYADEDVTTVSLTYQQEQEYLMFSITIVRNEEAVFGYEFEKTAQQDVLGVLNDQYVTKYYNQEGEVYAISWIMENAHYNVYGNLGEEEITRIVQGYQ